MTDAAVTFSDLAGAFAFIAAGVAVAMVLIFVSCVLENRRD